MRQKSINCLHSYSMSKVKVYSFTEEVCFTTTINKQPTEDIYIKINLLYMGPDKISF